MRIGLFTVLCGWLLSSTVMANDFYYKLGGGIPLPVSSLTSDPQPSFGIMTGSGWRFGSIFEPVGVVEYNHLNLRNPVVSGTNVTGVQVALVPGGYRVSARATGSYQLSVTH